MQWELDSPSGSYASLEEVDTDVVQFEPDMAGTFTIRLEVTDGRGGVDRASLDITPSLPTPDALPLFASTAPPTPKIKDRTDAVRLLYQGTFGPRDGDIDALIRAGRRSLVRGSDHNGSAFLHQRLEINSR